MEIRNSFYYQLIVVVAALSLYVFVQFFRGEESIVSIHDNLDSTVAYLKFLSDSELLFSMGNFDKLFNIDRNILPSEYNVATLLFYFLPAFKAYVTIVILKVILSLYSMYQLLRLPVFDVSSKVALWIGATYSVMPGFPIAYLSQAIIPLMFVFFYKGVNACCVREKLFYGAMLIGTAFFSSLIMHGLFFLIYTSGFVLFLCIKGFYKKAVVSFLYCLFLSIAFVCIEYRLFYLQFISSYESIRSDFVLSYNPFFQSFKSIMLNGHYHFETNSKITIILSFFLFVFVFFVNKNKVFKTKVFFIIAIIIVNYILYSLCFTEIFIFLLSKVYPSLSGVDWSRIVFLNTIFWFVLIGVLSSALNFKIVSYMLMIFFINTSLMKTEYNDFRRNLYYGGPDSNLVSYNDFYNPSLFEYIKKDVNYSGEWAIAVGFHPAVLSYNGISTLDSYFSFGSKYNKDRFRTLIYPQLELNNKQERYFDEWGGRLYVFENNDNYRKTSVKHVCTGTDLNIDVQVFKAVGGRFIFSLCPIDNAVNTGLVNIRKYEWTAYGEIYVYQVKLETSKY